MGIRIDALDPAASAQADHEIPAMRSGQTVKLTGQQLATFIIALITDSAPSTLDTLNELAAALGDDPNFATTVTIALAGKQPLDAMLTALAALTSSNGKFLAFSGPDAPVARDIVGTVSQSGGVPTGAIIERGSNANGEYVRYADGTQICWGTVTGSVAVTTTSGGIWASAQQTQVFPVSFLTGTTPVFTPSQSVGWIVSVVSSPASATFFYANSASATTTRTLVWQAVGRWF